MWTLYVEDAGPDLVEIFQLLREPELVPRYNIAPTQPVAVVRRQGQFRELSLLHWGLVPSWSKDPRGGPPLINARSETAAEKPAFRSALARRRCLIPADGFYEWQKTGPKGKQPFYIRLAPDHPFAFAGLWECWKGAGEFSKRAGESSQGTAALESCTILTTDANDLLRPIHDRMPVILHEEDYDRWLDPLVSEPASLVELLKPFPPVEMTAYRVNPFVNNARNDSPRCIETEETSSPPLF